MTEYQRPWRCLTNTAADRGGSIHDDERARELGFRRAFVPGNVVASAAIPLIFDHFGAEWMSGGWFSFSFVGPVYTADEVQATAAVGDAVLDLAVRTRDGQPCCVGAAGTGLEAPWLEKPPEWGEVFPELGADFAFPDQEVVLSRDDALATLDAAGDDSPWYREASPWGDPVAPPETVLPLALHTMRGTRVPLTGAKGPGIWARHQVLVREPLHYDQPYRFAQRVVGKGIGTRSFFVEYEFELRDGDRAVLLGRHRGKFLQAAAQAK